MKLFLPALFGLLPFALAGDSQKSVVVTYPQDTPNSVLTTAKNAIIDAGGIITHEFQLIKGFAAEASANALQGLSALSAEYVPSIEEDKVVTVNDREVDA